MRLRSVLREPLFHFLLIGAALFVVFHWSGGDSGPTSHRIVITSGQINHLTAGFAKTWQRPPTDVELKGLIDEWVREEIATREAMTAGLDRDDTIIRRRLRQKLEFVVEDAAAAGAPSEQELQAWLAAHADDFRIEPQVAFRQVYVSRQKRGAAAEADARAILARLNNGGADVAIEGVGDTLMLPQEVELVSRREIARAFGPGFAEKIGAVTPGKWTGPVESGFGLHLVLVREHVEGVLPELAKVRPAVEREFMADRRKRQLAATYERLLEKYKVVIEQPEGAKASAGTRKAGP